MRTGSHLPPLLPRPQSPAVPSRAPMSLPYRPAPTIVFDPITSTYITTGLVEIPPQIGRFGTTPPHPRQVLNAFSDVAVSRYTPLGWSHESNDEESSVKQAAIPKYKPTNWIFEDDEDETFADKPGHAAYYKSRKFQAKVAAGEVQVPGGVRSNSFVSRKQAMERKRAKSEPLVMIFGLHNVRRARVDRKADLRLQKHNKRA